MRWQKHASLPRSIWLKNQDQAETNTRTFDLYVLQGVGPPEEVAETYGRFHRTKSNPFEIPDHADAGRRNGVSWSRVGPRRSLQTHRKLAAGE
jgi:hypothetical protein